MQIKPIKIAILAMGGEGGGVLADWIVNLGEQNGYFAQTTSVPGVAQRTGATIYYVELFPHSAVPDGKKPVLALMPMPGDVDVVLASELMEAGRAVQRGLVSDDRTTLVASTHRVYSIAEKSAMGDGRVDDNALIAHASQAAKRFVYFNMEKAAEDSGSVISAVLFGALASTGVLPFSRSQFEQTIERGGVGVKPSLKAFGAAYARVAEGDAGKAETENKPVDMASLAPRDPAVAKLIERVRAEVPAQAQPIVVEGVRRVLDFQDVAYANVYLDRLKKISQFARPDDVALIRETGRYLALWMSYEDAIRVAELKTRSSRFDRVHKEVRAADGQIVAINEYMHPRVEEISEILPFASVGRWLMRPTWGNKLVKSQTKSGRVIQTSSVRGFIPLYLLSGFKRWRRRTLRYQAEQQRIEGWLKQIEQAADAHPALALEIAQCQRLVKGYGDTHARGLRNYQTVMSALERNASTMSPALLGTLRDAALADEHGTKLEAALRQYALV